MFKKIMMCLALMPVTLLCEKNPRVTVINSGPGDIVFVNGVAHNDPFMADMLRELDKSEQESVIRRCSNFTTKDEFNECMKPYYLFKGISDSEQSRIEKEWLESKR